MKNNELFWKELYPKLGHLFYAVAFADGTIKTAEIEKLKKTVKERWVPAEESHDEFGSDAAFQIIAVFDWLAAEQTSNEKAYDVFAGFYSKNRKWFDAAIQENILQTTVDISLSFRGKNKEEDAFIKNLKKLLDKKT